MRRAAALWIGGASVAMSLTAVGIFAGISGIPGLPAIGFYGVATTVTGVGFGIVGLAIAIRRPGHPMGWVALAIALSQSAGSLTEAYATFGLLVAPEPIPLADLSSWLALWIWAPGLWLLVSLTYLFPDGAPRRRGQRLLAGLAVLGTLLMAVPTAIVTWPYRGPLLLTDSVSSGIPGSAMVNALQLVGVVLNLVMGIGGVVYLVVRYRSSTGVERQQRKWFVAAAAVLIALLWLTPFVSFGPPLDAVLGIVCGLVLPAAIGIAILRYRLYEIDRVVSRTIGWAIVTGILVAVFTGLVVGLQAVLSPVTEEDTLAVAASTLVAFALFQPLRRRVQRAVDRRFDRARYDGERVAAAFTDRLRDQVDLAGVERDLGSTVSAALSPASTGVWLRGVRS